MMLWRMLLGKFTKLFVFRLNNAKFSGQLLELRKFIDDVFILNSKSPRIVFKPSSLFFFSCSRLFGCDSIFQSFILNPLSFLCIMYLNESYIITHILISLTISIFILPLWSLILSYGPGRLLLGLGQCCISCCSEYRVECIPGKCWGNCEAVSVGIECVIELWCDHDGSCFTVVVNEPTGKQCLLIVYYSIDMVLSVLTTCCG